MRQFGSYPKQQNMIGRQTELEQLRLWLFEESFRLVTIVGPGGIGKTRLAQALAESSPYTLVWVRLDEIEGPGNSVLSKIGQELELPEGTPAEWHERFDILIRGSALIVLDSFEHIREQSSELTELLRRHQQVSILVTSRAPLLLAEEQLLNLESLSLEQSAELLSERARAVRPGFASTPENAELIEALCRRLDGIPLALELAAARLRHLGLPQLERSLQKSVELLSGGGPDRPPRQKTLAATLEWSCRLLSEAERDLLGRLTVFRGGFDSAAAEIISPSTGLAELLSLADQSLLVARHQSNSETRYGLLDTVRTWAAQTLLPADSSEALALAHAEYFLKVAERMSSFRGSSDHAQGLKSLAGERANLALALQTFVSRQMYVSALRLVGCLGWYWEACSLLEEGTNSLETALNYEDRLTEVQRCEAASAHHWLGILQRHHGSYDLASAHAAEAFELFSEPSQKAEALCSMGQLQFRQGDYQGAKHTFEEALNLSELHQDSHGEINALNGLGRIAWVTGEVSEGIEHEHASLRLAQLERYPSGEAWAHNALGEIHRSLHEPRAAALHFKRASEAFQELHEFSLAALALQNLAYVELGLKRWDEAQRGFREALTLWRKAGARHGLALCLIGLAGVLSAQKRDRLGVKFLGAADSLLDSIQVKLESSDRDDYTQICDSLKSRLGDSFAAIHWEGQQSPLDELLQLLDSRQTLADLEGLTSREIEVLKVAATGASNKEIAEILVISPQTVMVHLRSVYRKINVTSRTAASRWAVENGLLS